MYVCVCVCTHAYAKHATYLNLDVMSADRSLKPFTWLSSR